MVFNNYYPVAFDDFYRETAPEDSINPFINIEIGISNGLNYF